MGWVASYYHWVLTMFGALSSGIAISSTPGVATSMEPLDFSSKKRENEDKAYGDDEIGDDKVIVGVAAAGDEDDE